MSSNRITIESLDAYAAERERTKRAAFERVLALPLIVVAALVLMNLDQPIAGWLHRSGLDEVVDHSTTAGLTGGWWVVRYRTLVLLPGVYTFVLLCAGAVLVFHRYHWRPAGFVALSGLSGVVPFLMKWIAGRSRPFTGAGAFVWSPFRGGLPGLFHQVNLGFPSGHTAMAFTWAASMTVVFPRYRGWFYAWAVVVGMERVAENAHYLTDAVVAAVIGVVTVRLMLRILLRVVPPPPDTRPAAATPEPAA